MFSFARALSSFYIMEMEFCQQLSFSVFKRGVLFYYNTPVKVLHMTFTVGTVLAFNGQRGIAEDHYGNFIRFIADQVYPEDMKAIGEGVTILVYGTGMIELASSSFSRYASGE